MKTIKFLLFLFISVWSFCVIQAELSDYYTSLAQTNNSRDSIRLTYGEMVKSFLNTSADPCDDFYNYACGNYDGRVSVQLYTYQRNFEMFEHLLEKYSSVDNLENVFLFSEERTKHEVFLSSAEQNLIAFYKSCKLDETNEILTKNCERILNNLKWYSKSGNFDPNQKFDWISLVADLQILGTDVIIKHEIDMLTRNEAKIVLSVDSVISENTFKTNEANWTEKMKEVLIMEKINGNWIDDIVNFATEINNEFLVAFNNSRYYEIVLTLNELLDIVPGIPWDRFLNIVHERNVDKSEKILVKCLECFKNFALTIGNYEKGNINKLQEYLFFRHFVHYFDQPFKRFQSSCSDITSEVMGTPLSALYLRENFNENTHEEIFKLTTEIQNQFSHAVQKSSWIADVDKELFLNKINKYKSNIGYSKSQNFTDRLFHGYNWMRMSPDPNSYLENLRKARKQSNREKQKLGYLGGIWQPFDSSAYYNQATHEVNIPAGIITPPYYHKDFPEWANFGGLGTVIAHELTHGFDTNQFLFTGNEKFPQGLEMSTMSAFFERSLCLARQYNKYSLSEKYGRMEGLGGIPENIADNSGLFLAFKTFEKWLMANVGIAANQGIEGLDLSALQLFFVQFAQNWCDIPGIVTFTQSHAPSKFRVLGTLSNSNEFAEAFQCPRGTRMNPEKKCKFYSD